MDDNHIAYSSLQSLTGKFRLLVDTGADLNIIKINALSDEVIVNTHDRHQLQGINGHLVQTIGSTWLNLNMSNFILI